MNILGNQGFSDSESIILIFSYLELVDVIPNHIIQNYPNAQVKLSPTDYVSAIYCPNSELIYDVSHEEIPHHHVLIYDKFFLLEISPGEDEHKMFIILRTIYKKEKIFNDIKNINDENNYLCTHKHYLNKALNKEIPLDQSELGNLLILGGFIKFFEKKNDEIIKFSLNKYFPFRVFDTHQNL